ncbi:cytochrome B5-like protein isoform X1 [Primulina tabacum]|uniref:cytochrome B5-like protein isoform X1 n=1 Tax=Primulina tabacum TaxID=48773 RepID=UPI003F5ABA4D
MDVLLVTFFVGFVLALLIIVPRLRKSDPGSSRLSNSAGDKASKVYSKAEVSLHNRRTDCWIIIKEKVYDVTSYVEEHPGGDAILTHAGDDSTKGFYGPQHATRVFDMIEDFYVGDLKKFKLSITYGELVRFKLIIYGLEACGIIALIVM